MTVRVGIQSATVLIPWGWRLSAFLGFCKLCIHVCKRLPLGGLAAPPQEVNTLSNCDPVRKDVSLSGRLVYNNVRMHPTSRSSVYLLTRVDEIRWEGGIEVRG